MLAEAESSKQKQKGGAKKKTGGLQDRAVNGVLAILRVICSAVMRSKR